jgi:hypothetical protein
MLDSLLFEYRRDYQPYGCLESSDGAFKVYQLEAELCESFCHRQWIGRVVISPQFGNGSFGISGFPIEEIHPLGEGKYLLLMHGETRPAEFYNEEVYQAQVVLLHRGKMVPQEAFQYGLSGEGESHYDIGLYQESVVEIKMSMAYDPESKTLTYHYGHVLDIYTSNDGVEEQGVWKWQDGRFVEVEHTERERDFGR